jgi:hypothetical protein
MRLYYDRDGMDISAFFFTENMFAGAYDSFTTKTKSRHFIETIEDCHWLWNRMSAKWRIILAEEIFNLKAYPN